jgi:hypothetical protein
MSKQRTGLLFPTSTTKRAIVPKRRNAMSAQAKNEAPRMSPEKTADTCLNHIDNCVHTVSWNTQCHIAMVMSNPQDWNDLSEVRFIEHSLLAAETYREVRAIAACIRQGYEPVGWVVYTPETEFTCYRTTVTLLCDYVKEDPNDYTDHVIYDRSVEHTEVRESSEATQLANLVLEKFLTKLQEISWRNRVAWGHGGVA